MIEKLDIEIDRFIFIDFGSGKGRVLLVAAQFPFREVIGVEFSRQLHEIALRNIARFPEDQLHCRSIRSILDDAMAFVLPPSELVCYLYNSFESKVLTSVVQRLAAHAGNGYRIIVIYVNPVHREVFDQSGAFTVIAELPEEKWSPGAVVLTTRSANLSPQSDGKPRNAGRSVRARPGAKLTACEWGIHPISCKMCFTILSQFGWNLFHGRFPSLSDSPF